MKVDGKTIKREKVRRRTVESRMYREVRRARSRMTFKRKEGHAVTQDRTM